MNYTMASVNDCGLFALAYADSICNYSDPSLVVYNQHIMRNWYNNFIDSDSTHYGDLISENLNGDMLNPRIATKFWLQKGKMKIQMRI